MGRSPVSRYRYLLAAGILATMILVYFGQTSRNSKVRNALAGEWIPIKDQQLGMYLSPKGTGVLYTKGYAWNKYAGGQSYFRWNASKTTMRFSLVDEEGNPGRWEESKYWLSADRNSIRFEKLPIGIESMRLYRGKVSPTAATLSGRLD